MYEHFYGFTEPPFSLTPDPKFFFNGETHTHAYDLLKYGIDRGEGFIVVYGDIGTGKTTLCRTVLESIPKEVYTALILNPFLSETDLLRAILEDFGVISQGAPRTGQTVTTHDLITILNTFLLSIMRLNGRAVVLIDEAQNLPTATLEQLRILSNLETAKQKLLQIVLVGQSELKGVLARPELRQLAQRVSIRCELEPFQLDETSDYIRHRLSVASGGKSKVQFAPDALKVVQRYSNGTPRLINLIADRSLTAGVAAAAMTISGAMAKQAVDTLEFDRTRKAHGKSTAWIWVSVAAGVLALAVVLFLLLRGAQV
jgi:general secretion pathway protein A